MPHVDSNNIPVVIDNTVISDEYSCDAIENKRFQTKKYENEMHKINQLELNDLNYLIHWFVKVRSKITCFEFETVAYITCNYRKRVQLFIVYTC